MAAQKYVRLKERNGRIIDWHRELHITDKMEVFETDAIPPECIPDLTDWLVSVQSAKVARKVAAKAAE